MRSLTVVVAIALAAAAILAAVVVLAMGKGGELAEAHPDYPPLPLPNDRRLVAMDAAMLQLPRGLWGYHVDATDEALRRLAYALTERDTKVAMLEEQLAELRRTARPRDHAPAENSSWYAPPPETPWPPPETPSSPPETPWSPPGGLKYGPEPPPAWPAGHAAPQPPQPPSPQVPSPQPPQAAQETEHRQ